MIGKRTDSALCNLPDDHTWLTMYYIRPFLNDIINISFPFSQSYFTKCIGYNTKCIGAITVKSGGHQYSSHCNQHTL